MSETLEKSGSNENILVVTKDAPILEHSLEELNEKVIQHAGFVAGMQEQLDYWTNLRDEAIVLGVKLKS